MNIWKILTIIFLIIALVEGIFIIWAWKVGVDIIEKENKCQVNICGNYDAYLYDPYGNLCYCYKGDEIKITKYIK